MDNVHLSTVVLSYLKAEYVAVQGHGSYQLLIIYIYDYIKTWRSQWKCGKCNVAILCYNISTVLQKLGLFKV